MPNPARTSSRTAATTPSSASGSSSPPSAPSAPGRARPPSPRPSPAIAYDPACYLCPGNARSGGQHNPAYTRVFAFNNDFPSLLPEVQPADTNLYPSPLLRRRARARPLPRPLLPPQPLPHPRPHGRPRHRPRRRRLGRRDRLLSATSPGSTTSRSSRTAAP